MRCLNKQQTLLTTFNVGLISTVSTGENTSLMNLNKYYSHMQATANSIYDFEPCQAYMKLLLGLCAIYLNGLSQRGFHILTGDVSNINIRNTL